MAWPTGIAISGVYNYYKSQDFSAGFDLKYLQNKVSWKAEIVTFIYLFIGLRMLFGGLFYWLVTGEWKSNEEIQRYQYGREKYEKHHKGKKWANWNMQVEIFGQSFSVYALLTIPGILICNDTNPTTTLEIIGVCMWVSSYVIENVADKQKFMFIRQKAEAKVKGAVCNIGLW